jgi:hypothetical protein
LSLLLYISTQRASASPPPRTSRAPASEIVFVTSSTYQLYLSLSLKEALKKIEEGKLVRQYF